jgi:hypothetical protein
MKQKKILNKITYAIFIIAILALVANSIKSCQDRRKLESELMDYQNQVSELVGTVELENGVRLRLAQELDDLNDRYQAILGDNERLSEVINEREERIRTISQLNAQLSERIEFAGEATTTVITRTVCPEPNSTTTVQNETEDQNSQDPQIDLEIPNLRVDFSLEEAGFSVDGYTTTNPSYAELSLEQIDPFQIDIAITETGDGNWRGYVYEVNDRLDIDINELVVDPEEVRYMWYERLGVGAQSSFTSDGFAYGPALSYRFGRNLNWTVIAGPTYNNDWGANVGFQWNPFVRDRSDR